MSTYRLQLGPDLTFDQAVAHLDYLESLGVTDIYCSPILQAAPGSTHGYDVVDHTRISDAAGGRRGFERLATAAHARGMGVIVDVVPNHMGVPTPLYHNKPLWTVLKEGPTSPYASWFDGAEADEGILMPILGARIGTVLANGEITVESEIIPGFEDAGAQPVLKYFDHLFPLRAGTETLPMHLCVKEQFYRLAYWKVAAEELNFRRFFDVDTLVALRVEDPAVFDATHELLLDLFSAGHIDGFRIDHPDGLADPRGYMRRLSKATGGAWIAAEKILEGNESMPEDWPVAGTTGYDTSWRISALQCDANGYGELGSAAHLITGDIPGSLPEVTTKAKREIATTSLIAELHRIASLAHAICRDDIMLRDHTFGWIQACATELVIAFDRYRAYIVPGEEAPAEAVEHILKAAAKARDRLDPELHETMDVVVDLVLGREVGSEGRIQRDIRDELVVRFQQVCGAVTAKGVEDTAFYRWTHLVSLNEVGGSPDTWGLVPDEFHGWCATMARDWPTTMTAGSTHDTKRSEDVRTRINVISQYAPEWRALLTKLHPLAEGIEGHTENLLWQTLAGTWTSDGPIEAERLKEYALKAAREQKIWTSWTHQDVAREATLIAWVDSLYSNEQVMGAFADWFEFTQDSVRVSLLSRKAIQLTCLGVADNYQGCETVTNTLVDPDNRRQADFPWLARTLARLADRPPGDLGEEKLWLTSRILDLRRRRRDVFVGPDATYRPLPSSTGHAFCFARGRDPQVVTIATRLHRALAASMGFTEHSVVLPEGTWRDVLTGVEVSGGNVLLNDLLTRFPCAVLEKVGGPGGDDAVRSADALAGALSGDNALFRPQPAGLRSIGTPPVRETESETTGLLGWLRTTLFKESHRDSHRDAQRSPEPSASEPSAGQPPAGQAPAGQPPAVEPPMPPTRADRPAPPTDDTGGSSRA